MQLTKAQKTYIEIIRDLHKEWKPHGGQQIIIDNVASGCKNIFVQCGRKFGKSELTIYLLWRHALLNPGSSCYYIAPFLKQAREIVWSSRRVQTFIDPKYITKIDNQDLRIHLTNGSFIKIDGSDNYEAYRGITPDIVAYDEFKDFRPEFHEGMNPNLAVRKAPLIIIGTPPKPKAKNYRQYLDLAEEFRNDNESFWIQRTSFDNPHIDPKWLEKEKQKLIAKNEEDVWKREYLAEITGGGKNAIFPMFNREMIVAHDSLCDKIRKSPNKWEYYITTYPSSIGTFGVLISAIHKYNKEVLILTEISEKDKTLTSSKEMHRKIETSCKALNLPVEPSWFRSCDKAGSWFSEEAMTEFGQYYSVVKADDEGCISIMKAAFSHGAVKISDSCTNLAWELDNYIVDGKGRIIDEFNELIKCFQVLIETSYYSLVEVREFIKKIDPIADRGARSIEADVEDWKKEMDWTSRFK